ncbi:putative vacuolar (H+)-ATPase G subunit [Helianthus anomalus]
MEDYKRQGGIHQLLATEQEAGQIVNAARTTKSNRLKQAKDEAEDDVGKYRTHMEKDTKKQSRRVNVKRLDEETVKKIDHLKKQATKVSPEVVKLLMTQVTNV